MPDDIEGMVAFGEAGGGWLDWAGHIGDGLLSLACGKAAEVPMFVMPRRAG